MTENTAIKEIVRQTCEGCYGLDDSEVEMCKKCGYQMAIQALEEIQQYRAIGTVEEFNALKETDEDLRLKYCYEDLSEADNLGYMRGYNKAIDEFADELINHSIYADIGKGNAVKMEWVSPITIIKEIAEKMKGGADSGIH